MSLDLTYKSILRVLLLLVVFWLLYQVIDVLLVIFFGIIISSAIAPTVDKLQEKRIPRVIGAALIYLFIILVFIVIGYIILPPTIYEITNLSEQLPHLLKAYLGSLSLTQNFFEGIKENLATASSNAIGWLIGLAGGIGNVLFVFIISFYLTVEDRGIKQFLKGVLPPHRHEYIVDLINRSQNTLAQWLKAQLFLMFLVGILSFFALWVLGVPHALAIGVLAGLLEIIPFIGPAIAAIPALVFSFSISSFLALITILVFIAIQQLESQLLTPLVMKRAFEINPVLVLIALLLGAKLGGIIGILASVPLLALCLEFAKDYYHQKSE